MKRRPTLPEWWSGIRITRQHTKEKIKNREKQEFLYHAWSYHQSLHHVLYFPLIVLYFYFSLDMLFWSDHVGQIENSFVWTATLVRILPGIQRPSDTMAQHCVKVYHGLIANINQSTRVLKSTAIACGAKVKGCNFPVSRPQLIKLLQDCLT